MNIWEQEMRAKGLAWLQASLRHAKMQTIKTQQQVVFPSREGEEWSAVWKSHRKKIMAIPMSDTQVGGVPGLSVSRPVLKTTVAAAEKWTQLWGNFPSPGWSHFSVCGRYRLVQLLGQQSLCAQMPCPVGHCI